MGIFDNLSQVAKEALFDSMQKNQDVLDTSGDSLSGVLNFSSGSAISSAGAVTLNKQVGFVQTEALSTAAGSTYTLTVTNSLVGSSSPIIASVGNKTNSAGTPIVATVTPSTGSIAIVIRNVHASGAFNGSLLITFVVFNQGFVRTYQNTADGVIVAA